MLSLQRIGTGGLLLLLLACAPALCDEPFQDPTIRVTVEPPVLVSARFDAVIHRLADGSAFVHGNRSTDGGRTWTTSPAPVHAAFHDRWRQTAGCVLSDGTFIGLGFKTEFPRLDQRILKVYTSSDNLQTIEGPRTLFCTFRRVLADTRKQASTTVRWWLITV